MTVSPETPAVIDIHDLHHSYGSKQIYAGLRLQIAPGTLFGLLGKNGVGKSTLINILMGYLRRGDNRISAEPVTLSETISDIAYMQVSENRQKDFYGYAITADSRVFLIGFPDYRFIPLAADFALQQPAELSQGPMSLWHYLFELHNGKLFRQWLGSFTWLLIPIGGGLLLLVLLSGTFDWLWHKQKIRPRRKMGH